jgi:hypothetical protein
MKHMFANEGISRVSIFVRVILGQISLDGSVQHLNTMEGKVCIWFSSKVLCRRLIFNTLAGYLGHFSISGKHAFGGCFIGKKIWEAWG